MTTQDMKKALNAELKAEGITDNTVGVIGANHLFQTTILFRFPMNFRLRSWILKRFDSKEIEFDTMGFAIVGPKKIQGPQLRFQVVAIRTEDDDSSRNERLIFYSINEPSVFDTREQAIERIQSAESEDEGRGLTIIEKFTF